MNPAELLDAILTHLRGKRYPPSGIIVRFTVSPVPTKSSTSTTVSSEPSFSRINLLGCPRSTPDAVESAAGFHVSTATVPLRDTRTPLSTSAGSGARLSAAQRRPTKLNARDGLRPPTTASAPAPVPSTNEPARVSAPGPPTSVLAPARHIRSSLSPPQPVHAVESGTQSATHSGGRDAMCLAVCQRAPDQAGRDILRLLGRAMPSLPMRASSVVRFSPRMLAAPLSPLTRQPTFSRTDRM